MKRKHWKKYGIIMLFLAVFALALSGCSGDDGSTGSTGATGAVGSNKGTLTGTVTAPDGATALAGVTVTNNLTTDSTTTDSTGKFSLSLPIGTYTLTFAKSGFTTATATVTVAAAGATSSVTAVALAGSSSGLPSASITSDKNEVGYGNTVNLTATVTAGSNSSTLTYAWAITPPSAGSAQGLAKIAQDATDPKKAVVTMPAMYDTTAFRGAFDGTVKTIGGQIYKTMPYDYTPTTDLKGAAAAAGTIVPADQNYVAKFVPQTFTGAPKVLPISPDTRAAVTVKFTVTDSLGGKVNVGMPSTSPLFTAAVQPGVNDVALGTPIYLNSGHATPWAWTLTPPAGSTATLSSATGQYPYFRPDVVGKYTVTEGANTTAIWAGKFVGVIASGSYTTKTFNLNNEMDKEKSGMWYDTTTSYWSPGATSTTYTNWPVVIPDSGCTACHANGVVVNGLTAPDKITPWALTAHATFFARGIEGITGNSGSCLTCHTTGYDLSAAAANGGFDDVAAAIGWTYPATRKSGNWAAMFTGGFDKVARLSNIQCENCHGPQDTGSAGGTGAHISGVAGATRTDLSTVAGGTRVNFSSEVCAACHASGTGHHFYSEWATLSKDGKGHSNLALAQSRYNCGCHSAQAFAQFVPQLQNGVVDYDIKVTNPTGVTWSAADAQPQTCTACHDPHDATNPFQLRVYDSALLPAGFSVSGVGKGALCMVCHNTRTGQQCNGTVVTEEPLSGILPAAGPIPAGATTGTAKTVGACIVATAGDPTRSQTLSFLHEDGVAYQQANPLFYANLHDATQADVLMGRNAFFMGNDLPMLSKHASVKDSCVGCHMTLNPTTHLSHGAAATSSHTFAIADAEALCANCHSANVGPSAIEANTQSQQASLIDAMAAYIKARINAAVGTAGAALYRSGSGTVAAPYVYTAFTTVGKVVQNSAGSTSFQIFKADNTTRQGATATATFSYSSVYVQTATGYSHFFINASAAIGNKLFKAGYNYLLTYRDYSNGIHNPTFVNQVLNNSIAQMKDTTQ